MVNNDNMPHSGPPPEPAPEPLLPRCCAIRFRPGDQTVTAISRLDDLCRDEVIMVQTDHGLEPALMVGRQPAGLVDADRATGEDDSSPAEQDNQVRRQEKNKDHDQPRVVPTVIRRASREEQEKFLSLQAREKDDFRLAQELINRHRLPMKLIRAERFFNGGKIIFYFTAENRVDFRELVKDMVHEFRTRVEIRQVGVRHETKMIGGLGCCGRELCCSSFINQFAPVSIKMAKEQGLPLNPAKISGICNRLLCCLTYEFETYKKIRRQMPKQGKTVSLDGQLFKVLKLNILEENIEVCNLDEPERVIVWQASEWQRCEPAGGSGKPAQEQAPAEKGPESKKTEQPRRGPARNRSHHKK